MSRAGHMTLQRLPQPATLGLPADSIGSRLAAEKTQQGADVPLEDFKHCLWILLDGFWG